MGGSGAPTNQWQTLPKHLNAEERSFDLHTAGARLVVKRPGLPDVEIRIEKEEFLIGRAVDGVDLTLDDERVSRNHARLTVNERGYFRLEDLGSKNGIEYLGRTTRRLNLVDGDVFKIGQAELCFHAEMNRFRANPSSVAKPRPDSVFAKVNIPTPEPESEVSGDDDIGWSPDKARPEPQGTNEGE